MKDKQDELFVVVDKKDRIIGYRTRYECHHNKNLIHRAIGVVVFNKKGQILMQKRSRFKDLNPGLFTISASGHVTKGQTYYRAAQRELEEELGIKIPLTREKNTWQNPTRKQRWIIYSLENMMAHSILPKMKWKKLNLLTLKIFLK